ncbi:hypothetical protein C0J52_27288 [Blattella germanica]|nr:hypothetical protein C0J52_27288 [Blattella germanica]
MLEIEPNVKNSTSSKDKRSPQHQSSQAVFGASPGQFVVRTSNEESAQPEVPPEYLSLLQQLVAQQEQSAGAEATPQQPVINQLLIARNPDPSAVQFTSVPGQPQRPRRPPSPQAQLQQLYFNSQFQQQIPVRPRILRPRPPPQPSQEDFATLSATGSRVHSIHEARLRASLAGTDPDLAVQALGQQQVLPTSASTPSPLFDEQLTQLATASQDHVSQLQALPQQAISQQQLYTANPQIQYVQQPQPVQRAASYPSAGKQSAPSAQHISSERSKLSRRPVAVPAPQQYLRETTQPIPEQTQSVRQQETSDPKVYLTSQAGHQTPESNQDEDELISQLLSGGRGLFPGASPTPATAAEEIIRSTTALPPTPSRSSIFVTQTSNLKGSGGRSKITIEDVDTSQEDSKTPIPVVHLPTPDGQRPLTQTELQALIDAGFNIQPAPEESTPAQSVASQYYQQTTTKSVSPQYYQQSTTKKQRSYVTPAPPRNQVAYESRLKKPQEEKEEIRYVQHVSAQEEEIPQRSQLNTRYRLQGSKPQQEKVVQFVRQNPHPPPPQDPGHRQGSQYTRFRIVVNNPEPEEYQFIQVPASPESQEHQEREQLSTYEPQSEEAPQTTQYHRFQAQRESIAQQIQSTRYQPDNSESQEQTYHTEPQQTKIYQRDETVAPQVSRFHQPIVVAELPSTTPVPTRTTPRRRRPRPPTHSRIVFRTDSQGQAQKEVENSENVPQRFLVAYDNVPEATSFGTRNRVRGRRPNPSEES